jgi:hypothetical protein
MYARDLAYSDARRPGGDDEGGSGRGAWRRPGGAPDQGTRTTLPSSLSLRERQRRGSEASWASANFSWRRCGSWSSGEIVLPVLTFLGQGRRSGGGSGQGRYIGEARGS